MARRQAISITREGWCYAVVVLFIFSGALLRDINLLMFLFALLVGPFLFNFFSARRTLRRLDVVHDLPDVLTAGQSLDVTLRITNSHRARGSWAVVIEDRIERVRPAGTDHPLEPFIAITRVPPGELRRSYRAMLTCRGQYRFGPVRMTTRFPFGFFRGRRKLDSYKQLIVLPRMGRYKPLWASSIEDAHHTARRHSLRKGFMEGDFHGLRDWRRGDPKRWIHWRTTARQGNLMVREFERRPDQDMVVVLDAWRPEHDDPRAEENLEMAVSAVATMIAATCRGGDHQITFVSTAGDRVPRHGLASMAFLRDVLETLALLEAESTDRLAATLETVISAVPPGAKVTLVTPRRVDPANLAAAERFAGDPHARLTVAEMDCISVLDPGFETCFQFEG